MNNSGISRVKGLHLPLIVLVVLAISLFAIKSNLFAGTDFTAQENISGDSAYSVGTADIDKDGDSDVVAALNEASQIVWYKNNGSGTFGEAIVLADETPTIQYIHLVDIDGDTDTDVLAALYGRTTAPAISGRIILYKNNGAGIFDDVTIIDQTGCEGAKGVYAEDLDLDGDLDILSASTKSGDLKSGTIAWYENTGGGNFSGTATQTLDFENATSVIAADIDGVNGVDIVASSDSKDEIVWFQNNGETPPVFTMVYGEDIPYDENNTDDCDNPITIDETGRFAISLNAAGSSSLLVDDLNNDGKPDIISASGDHGDTRVGYYDRDPEETNADCELLLLAEFFSLDGDGAGNNIEWFENTVTSATDIFPVQKIIAPNVKGTNTVISTHINRETDEIKDLVYTALTNGSLYYSLGKGPDTDPGPYVPPYNPFEDPKLITDVVESVKSVAAADFDGDGDMDIVSASYENTYTNPPKQGKIMWFKNVNGYIITPITGDTTEQNEGTATFTVRLDTLPNDTVSLPVSSSDETEGTVSSGELVFTTENWSEAQTVTVKGVNDDEDDSDQTYTILLGPATSTDIDYNGTDPDDISLENIDNDDELFTDGPGSGTNTGGSSGGCFVNTVK